LLGWTRSQQARDCLQGEGKRAWRGRRWGGAVGSGKWEVGKVERDGVATRTGEEKVIGGR